LLNAISICAQWNGCGGGTGGWCGGGIQRSVSGTKIWAVAHCGRNEESRTKPPTSHDFIFMIDWTGSGEKYSRKNS
jgi:hypothetical protein